MKVVNQLPCLCTKQRCKRHHKAAAKSHTYLRDRPLPAYTVQPVVFQLHSAPSLSQVLLNACAATSRALSAGSLHHQGKKHMRSFPPGHWLFYGHISGDHLNGKSRKDQAVLGLLLSNEMSLLSDAVFLDQEKAISTQAGIKHKRNLTCTSYTMLFLSFGHAADEDPAWLNLLTPLSTANTSRTAPPQGGWPSFRAARDAKLLSSGTQLFPQENSPAAGAAQSAHSL